MNAGRGKIVSQWGAMCALVAQQDEHRTDLAGVSNLLFPGAEADPPLRSSIHHPLRPSGNLSQRLGLHEDYLGFNVKNFRNAPSDLNL